MASTNGALAMIPPPKTKENDQLALEEELNKLKLSLPKLLLFNHYTFYNYQGSWIQDQHLGPTLAMHRHFEAQDTDILVTSSRKTGTTWLKALVFCICNRADFDSLKTHVQTHNPHELVPFFESNIYYKSICSDPDHFISSLKPPRLFATHLPFQSLPSSVKDDSSKSKIVYIARNPLDTFVSSWVFYQKIDGNKNLKPEMLGYYFDHFCEGKVPFGPFEDHVLGYWKQSLERSDKVFFVKYEDLKADPKPQLKRMAEFLGYPFSVEEEARGVIADIVKLCSFESLKEAKAPKWNPTLDNKWYFRKGETGDWVNYLTREMAERLKKLMDEKFEGSGLTLY